jgi:hypothetical protein
LKSLLKPTAVLAVMLLLVVLALVVPIAFKGTRPALTAAGGLLAAVAALGYALLTFSLVDATERLTRASADSLEAQTRPNVIVRAQPYRTILFLMVENKGAGEAFNVRFEVTGGSFERFPKQRVTEARFMREGFAYLAPGQEYGVMAADQIRQPEGDPSATVTVTYRSRAGREYVGTFPIHLLDLFGLDALEGHTPIGRIAKALEKIQTHVTGDSTT